MPNTTKTTPAVITKYIGIPLEKSAERTYKGTLMVTGYFTSDSKDMHGDIITRGATERAFAAYRQWGNVRRMHAPDPVGKVRGIGVEDGDKDGTPVTVSVTVYPDSTSAPTITSRQVFYSMRMHKTAQNTEFSIPWGIPGDRKFLVKYEL